MSPENSPQPVALVTGASRGIGAAVARMLGKKGYNLILTARTIDALETLAEEIRGQSPQVQVLVKPADVTDTPALERLVEESVAAMGRIDVLINNAGIAYKIGLLQEMSMEDIDRTLDVNLKAPIHLMKYVLPHMVGQQSGTIININSVAGKTAYPYWAVYDASKFGLHAMTQAVGEEQRSNNIRVVGIYPGAVATDIWDTVDLESAPNRGNMLQPTDVAQTISYILDQPMSVYIPEVMVTPLQPAL